MIRLTENEVCNQAKSPKVSATNRARDWDLGVCGSMVDKPDDKGGADRRKLERTAVLWSGSLVCESQDIDCVIVNVSSGGALVRVENPAACKKSVVLRCPRFGELSGEITWRQDKELGIEFQDSEQVVAKKMEKALHEPSQGDSDPV